jgi:hypothetical protein
MNIFLWVLQVLLALHTFVGAIWKYSNSERMMPSTSTIPHEVWLGMSILEIVVSAALVVPAFNKNMVKFAPIAAGCIVVEMLFFTLLNIASGHPDIGSITYWVVVAAIAAFIAYGRLVLKPTKIMKK